MSLNNLSPNKLQPAFNNVELNQNRASSGYHIQFLDNLAVHYIWTGTPVGTFGISVCNDATLNQDGTVSGGTWAPVVSTTPQAPTATGSSGTGVFEYNQSGMAFLQVTYTYTSGDGYCTALLTGKGV